MTKQTILEDLGDNLVMRRSTPEDGEAIGKFQGLMQVDPGEDFVDHIYLWVKELLAGKHPTFNTDDFTIVENTSTGEIVSCLCLINQTWSYSGIQFGVGRPELVATHPDYRRRGLVRKQFDVVHQWSAERGQKVQFITGIPWYYRQFGYEMAVNLGGSKLGSPASVPQLKADNKEQFTFRQAAEKDIGFITNLYAHSNQRSLLSCERDEKNWLYELTGRAPKSTLLTDMQIIEDLTGKSVGYLIFGSVLDGGKLNLLGYELIEGVSWLHATPAVQRHVKTVGEQFADRDTSEQKKVELKSISFSLGEAHPCYQMLQPHSMPITNPPYAYYMRVTDLPDFLMTIAPVLEERLANSYAVSHSGEVKLNFFTDGLILIFEAGKLTSAKTWQQPDAEKASAHFPELTFLQLLFGYRSYDEIYSAYPDCYCPKYDASVLLKILFPKQPSRVYDLG